MPNAVLLITAPILPKYRLHLVVLLAVLVPLHVQDSLACSCGSEPDFLTAWAGADGAFQGTVIDVLEGEGPRKIVFDVHLVQKGVYPYGKYVFEDHSVIDLGDGMVQSSSCKVNYQRGETYQVFVHGGLSAASAGICTTKQISGFKEYSQEGEDGQMQHHILYYSFFDQYGLLSLPFAIVVPAIIAGALIWIRKRSARH